jgi:hypothetical protein
LIPSQPKTRPVIPCPAPHPQSLGSPGKQARDTFLSLLKTCSKLAISFWDYLGARLNIPDADRVPWLPDLIRQNASA